MKALKKSELTVVANPTTKVMIYCVEISQCQMLHM